mgnify:CR=1 FL=1
MRFSHILDLCANCTGIHPRGGEKEIFKKYIELDDINDVNEYIVISVKDIKNMLSCSGEEYERILSIVENSNKSKKLVKDFDNI